MEELGTSPAATDPAGEFLAREQEELGQELGEELGISSGPAAVGDDAGDSSVTKMEGADLVGGGEEEGKEQFEVLDVPEGISSNLSTSNSTDDLGSAFNSLRVRPSEEPETIKKWKLENEELLKEKDAKEAEMMQDLKEQAKKELQDWYKDYNNKLTKTKEDNRLSEKEFVSEINDITPGTEWERVNKLCDFNTKNNKNSRDVSRMRSILLKLKQNPISVN